MVKDTCKQERKTQLQQVGISSQAREARTKRSGWQLWLRVRHRCRAKQQAAGAGAGLTCHAAPGHTPTPGSQMRVRVSPPVPSKEPVAKGPALWLLSTPERAMVCAAGTTAPRPPQRQPKAAWSLGCVKPDR